MTNKRYYCSENPAEHKEFIAPAVISQYWFVDENGEYQSTMEDGDLLSEADMEVAECSVRDCKGLVIYGIPPSALEQLANAALADD